ncbi:MULTISPECIES: hypothetical protein [unclassified Corynebacterium]|uniref:hypothetical protein n=1 Tax=unclassified Corynebacterium TaxID=2624378 RepID=UPI00143D1D8B|nr:MULTISPECIES: hypothetical protein [unclassified Corynebacterium]
MKRSEIEKTKAIVITVFAITSFLLVLWVHDYSMAWLPLILGALAGWFWWKTDHFSH